MEQISRSWSFAALLAAVTVELREFPCDWLKEEPLVRLHANDLLRVIDRFLAGHVVAKQLQDG